MSQKHKKVTTDKRINEHAEIKARLVIAGLTLADVERDYNLKNGTARIAMIQPNLRGERAIAQALKMQPHLLWSSRYYPSGVRHKPQDWTRIITLKQRRYELEQRV